MNTKHETENSKLEKEVQKSDASDFGLRYIKPEQITQLPPCGSNCPSGGNVRHWIGLVAQRNKLGLTTNEAYRKAWETIVEYNPFPATMGRICPHPCEDQCNRVGKDGAVAVNELERFLGDFGIEHKLPLQRLEMDTRPESIAVIGAGPAGLSFAYQMARRGYHVSVFDKHDLAGGMLRFGIPDYRLPPEVLDAEIRKIKDLGVEFLLGVQVGTDVTVKSLRDEFDVLFIGVGAQTGRRLGIPGEDGPGVYTGTDYLHRINTGDSIDIGCDVVVIGGGNTAIDAARASRRQGASVTILYRRTRSEMPAIEHEINEALEEGVEIEYLTSPVEICRNPSGIESVTAQRMKLGDLDSSGRRRPVPIENSYIDIKATSVMTAISQEPDWTAIHELHTEGGWMETTTDGLVEGNRYAGGDVRGLGLATQAIGHGRAAAEKAHARLRGLETASFLSEDRTAGSGENVKLDFYETKDRVNVKHNPVEARLRNPALELSHTIGEDAFLQEASRCLSCESCFGCQHCWMYCNAVGFSTRSDPGPGNYFKLDLSVCEGCGKCIDVCPCGFLHSQKTS